MYTNVYVHITSRAPLPRLALCARERLSSLLQNISSSLLHTSMDNLAPTHRREFTRGGRIIYQWDQTVDEVNVYIAAPPDIRARNLDVRVSRERLSVGIKDTLPYLDHSFAHAVRADDSLWCLSDGELRFTLCKATRGTPWRCVFVGHDDSSDADGVSELQSRVDHDADAKRLLLERFQMENPGFDFSNAMVQNSVGDSAPDAGTFMGGMR